jgi:hypothetical protein
MIDTAFIEFLVGFCLMLVLISDPDQKEPSLSAINGDLSDDLIKTLFVQLFSFRAQANLPRLSLNQSLVKLLAELYNLIFGGRCGQYGLDPELAVVGTMLFGGKDLA